MLDFEKVNLFNFKSNRITFGRNENELILGPYIDNLAARSGEYVVTLILKSSKNLIWWGDYQGYEKINLVPGTSKFKLNLKNESSFKVGIMLYSDFKSRRFEITHFKVERLDTAPSNQFANKSASVNDMRAVIQYGTNDGAPINFTPQIIPKITQATALKITPTAALKIAPPKIAPPKITPPKITAPKIAPTKIPPPVATILKAPNPVINSQINPKLTSIVSIKSKSPFNSGVTLTSKKRSPLENKPTVNSSVPYLHSTNKPNVSVILPTYKRFEGFVKVINDMLAQKFTKFELIAIDDSSSPELYSQKREFIDKLNDSRIKLIQNSSNIGVAATLNKGIDLVKGDYITWISDDNHYYSNYLSALYVPGHDFIYSYWDMHANNRMTTVHSNYPNLTEVIKRFRGLASFMWSASIVKKIGYYNVNLPGCEDYDYLIRTYMNTNNILLQSVRTMTYVNHPGSTYHTEYDAIMRLKAEIVNIYSLIVNNIHKKVVIYDVDSNLNQQNGSDMKYIIRIVKSNNIVYQSDKHTLSVPEKLKSIVVNIYADSSNLLHIDQSLLKANETVPVSLGKPNEIAAVSKESVPNPTKTPSVSRIIETLNLNTNNVVTPRKNSEQNSVPVVPDVQKVNTILDNIAISNSQAQKSVSNVSIVDKKVSIPAISNNITISPICPKIIPVASPNPKSIPTTSPKSIPPSLPNVSLTPNRLPSTHTHTPIIQVANPPPGTAAINRVPSVPTVITTSSLPKITHRISIVMSYFNRRSQLENTLQIIKRSSIKNIEIIITDDASEASEAIDDFVEKYGIRLIKNSAAEKTHINSVVGYNQAISLCTGDIVIIQNPEVCYVGDILKYASDNINNHNYLSFSCLALPNFAANYELKTLLANTSWIKVEDLLSRLALNPQWYNHPTITPTHFHFCAAISRVNLEKIRGFSIEYRNGYCFDDDDLVLKVRMDLKLKLQIIHPSELYVIHQYHKTSPSVDCDLYDVTNPIRANWERNKKLLQQKHEMKERLARSHASRIPKIFNCYWDRSPMSYLVYLTVKSFSYYNPDWDIHVYIPIKQFDHITWSSFEQKVKYTGKSWWDEFIKIRNVKVISIDFKTIGFDNDVSEVIKSDFLRWHILSTIGGIWSDLDILYVNSIENAILKQNSNFDTMIFHLGTSYQYYPIGFFMSKPNNELFKFLKEQSLIHYDAKVYQSIGAFMIRKLWPQCHDMIRSFPNLNILVEDKYIYLPYEYNELEQLFDHVNLNNLKSKTIGIHWFNGSPQAKTYQNEYTSAINKNVTLSILVKKFEMIDPRKYFLEEMQIINPNYIQHTISNPPLALIDPTKISIVMAYYNRKEQLITTLDSIRKSAHNNFNVVIVDDASDKNHRLEDIIHRYPFEIKLIRIEPQNKKWINPCVPYNIGLQQADGNIVIIQNPEVFHVGDILSHAASNIKAKEYHVYSCYATPDFSHNHRLREILDNQGNSPVSVNPLLVSINYAQYAFDWKYYVKQYADLAHITTEAAALEHWTNIGRRENRICNIHKIYAPPQYITWRGWYNHPTIHPRPLHFLAATHRANVQAIGYFNEAFKDGLWYDDDDFLKRITMSNRLINHTPENVFGIHQYHDNGSVSHSKKLEEFNVMVARNKEIHNTSNTEIVKNPKLDIIAEITLNQNLKTKRLGLAITTYSDETTSDIRLDIIRESFESLRKFQDGIKVIIVANDSLLPQHRAMLNEFASNFEIRYRKKEGGISAAKNTCIKSLIQANVDIGFLADDDMIYKEGWFRIYASNIITTGVDHLAFWPREITATQHDYLMKNTRFMYPHAGYAGCFVTFTPRLIEKIGYFRIFPYKYGSEHVDFSKRSIVHSGTTEVCDAYYSNLYLTLNPRSYTHKSFQIEMDKLQLNQSFMDASNKNEYVAFKD